MREQFYGLFITKNQKSKILKGQYFIQQSYMLRTMRLNSLLKIYIKSNICSLLDPKVWLMRLQISIILNVDIDLLCRLLRSRYELKLDFT